MAKAIRKPNKNKPKWLSIGQAASYMGVSNDTLRRWEKKGKIAPSRSPTNRRYYTLSILDEVMKVKKRIVAPVKSKKWLKLLLLGLGSLVISLAVVAGLLLLLSQ